MTIEPGICLRVKRVSDMLRRTATMPDAAICRAANLLIQQHGANAEWEASRRAEAMRSRGDCYGQLVWSDIRRAILGLQAISNAAP